MAPGVPIPISPPVVVQVPTPTLDVVARPDTCRPVERCFRAPDWFERRPPDPYDAPPGAVPYARYLQAKNRIEALIPRPRPSAEPPRHAAPPEPTESAWPEPGELPRGARASRLGDVTPTRAEAPEAGTIPRRVVTTREVATGLIFDAVF